MKDSKKFWDKSAEKYIKSPIKDEATYQQKLAITQEFLRPDCKVLEFGCGSGATAIFHAPYVEHIVATDISDKMIEAAQRKAIEAGVKNMVFQQGTLDSLTFQNESFDAVLGLNVLHLLEDVDGAIAKVYRLLKNDGVFVSSTSLIAEINLFFRWLISGMQFLGLAPYVSRFTKRQLISKLLESGFTIEREWQTSHESVFIVARKS
ncbi:MULTISPECIES: class I SAM-dependent methyltransferase [unclassified Methylophaga]|uniref:class I SAM-dependent methyltransferase n=1 Tax=unclassified Methylophaga TaxID=2629249 RepID=UPI000C929A42|nr:MULTISPECIES: class I SAM-dependent methyltransferase [unclassified Methylophaga]MBN45862.1 SAM-dependent methyltransferase [Methylophaga sp.]|tara:strand:+ start:62154 stop:62771 length:618 start_codon:yes stop_codon:yes gene_type:complete